MSKRRKIKGAWSTPLVRGPDGRYLCRWCKKSVPPPKITFCGPDCVHEWRLRSSPSYLRSCVRARDKEICALCKLDCKKLRIELRKLRLENRIVWEARCEELAIPKHRRTRSLWDADHIKPVCEGGGLCGTDNIRTLCYKCHRTATNELLARRRALKKASRPTTKKLSKKK